MSNTGKSDGIGDECAGTGRGGNGQIDVGQLASPAVKTAVDGYRAGCVHCRIIEVNLPADFLFNVHRQGNWRAVRVGAVVEFHDPRRRERADQATCVREDRGVRGKYDSQAGTGTNSRIRVAAVIELQKRVAIVTRELRLVESDIDFVSLCPPRR